MQVEWAVENALTDVCFGRDPRLELNDHGTSFQRASNRKGKSHLLAEAMSHPIATPALMQPAVTGALLCTD
jgi:hypothetical protein